MVPDKLAKYIGFVSGRDVSSLQFVTSHDEEVFIGDILVVEDVKRKDRKFLVRVTNVAYGNDNQSQPPEIQASRRLLLARHLESMDEESRERIKKDEDQGGSRLFLVGICEILGYTSEIGFIKPKTIPSHYTRVRKLEKEDLESIKDGFGDLVVGKLRSGEDIIDVPVGIHEDLIVWHIGVFSTTGGGKTNTIKRLIGALLDREGKTAAVAIDPHGEYYSGGGGGRLGLRHHPKAQQYLSYYTTHPQPGDSAQKLQFMTDDISINVARDVYGFSDAQSQAVWNLKSAYKSKNWIKVIADEDADTLKATLNAHDETIRALKAKVQAIMGSSVISNGLEYESGLDPTKPKSCLMSMQADLDAGKVVLISGAGLGDRDERLVSAIVASEVLRRNKLLYNLEAEKFASKPPVMMVLEEAQRVLRKGNALPTYSEITHEGRKFNVGLCCVTQQPKMIDGECLSQLNTLIILGLAGRGDRECLTDTSKQDVSNLAMEIQSLMPGECIITSPRSPFAVPGKIDLYEDYIANYLPLKVSKVTSDRGFF